MKEPILAITEEQRDILDLAQPWADTPILTDEDVARLAPMRREMNTLASFLKDEDTTMDDIKRIILMEYVTRNWKRDYVVDRCFSRLSRMYRFNAEQELTKHYYAGAGDRA
tara:strand:- start:845 stop:1177 length:333 start_codon:yes stop_codon:yes gene_type:complete